MAAHAGAEKKKRDTARQRAQASDESSGKIPRELREKLKKAKAAKGLLKDLEEQVRFFVVKWENQAQEVRKRPAGIDSDDEEIVFVGRNGQMSDWPPKPKTSIERDRLIFDSLANDRGASFGYVSRWYTLLRPKRLTLNEALAGSLDCFLLWSSHLVYNSWRPSKTRGLCGCSASTPQRQSCLTNSASTFVGHGLKFPLK